ncbi:MAG: DUF86 domain-containing protein [Ruminococcus sp.]|jgi:uncharacterized protein with HEPN domain|nr:DUF86 domain-containing protein [Ruminococcus sp.]
MTKRDYIALKRILKHCNSIKYGVKKYQTSERNRDDDYMYLTFICKEIEDIGELTIHMSDEIRHSTDTIPWNLIRKTRNRFAHEYYYVDDEEIWNAVYNDIPPLIEFCVEAINNNKDFEITQKETDERLTERLSKVDEKNDYLDSLAAQNEKKDEHR